MALHLRSGPAVEPVTAAEAKAHLRIDGGAEDVLIASLIVTSRLHVEAALDLALIDQDWTLQLDRWPDESVVECPLIPLASVSEVRLRDMAGEHHIIAPEHYIVDAVSRPGRLIWTTVPPLQPGLRAAGIEIDFSAGFGASAANVPAPIRQAVLLLVAHWYEHRDPGEIGTAAANVPAAVSELLLPYRRVRL